MGKEISRIRLNRLYSESNILKRFLFMTESILY